MYDPKVGRFISADPIGFEAGDANLYRYVENQSLTHIDPSGTSSILPLVAFDHDTPTGLALTLLQDYLVVAKTFLAWASGKPMVPTRHYYSNAFALLDSFQQNVINVMKQQELRQQAVTFVEGLVHLGKLTGNRNARILGTVPGRIRIEDQESLLGWAIHGAHKVTYDARANIVWCHDEVEELTHIAVKSQVGFVWHDSLDWNSWQDTWAAAKANGGVSGFATAWNVIEGALDAVFDKAGDMDFPFQIHYSQNVDFEFTTRSISAPEPPTLWC